MSGLAVMWRKRPRTLLLDSEAGASVDDRVSSEFIMTWRKRPRTLLLDSEADASVDDRVSKQTSGQVYSTSLLVPAPTMEIVREPSSTNRQLPTSVIVGLPASLTPFPCAKKQRAKSSSSATGQQPFALSAPVKESRAKNDVITFSGPSGDLLIYRKAPIGGGSFGNVLEATLNGDPCAVKILHGVFLFSSLPSHVQKEKLATFEEELQHLEGLRHPNIVSHLATYTEPDEQTPLLVMELMDENLSGFLERHKESYLRLSVQIRLSHDIAFALEYLHSKRIIHRDLSSNNILLNRRHAKIADFGISRLIDPNRFDKTLSTLAPGTKGYMPPEAWKYSGKYNEKFDIFALGVLVIQIITCLPPAPGDRADVSGRIVSEFKRRREHIHCIQSDNPLRQIALHCIRDDSAARPIAADVHSWLDAYPRSAKIDVQLRRGVTAADVRSPKSAKIDVQLRRGMTANNATVGSRMHFQQPRKFGQPLQSHVPALRSTLGKPKMQELLKLNIPAQVGAKHQYFGIFLLEDDSGMKVASIARRYQGNVEQINLEILREWLNGRGRHPVTWETLCDVLEDTGLLVLASRIRSTFTD